MSLLLLFHPAATVVPPAILEIRNGAMVTSDIQQGAIAVSEASSGAMAVSTIDDGEIES